MELHWSMANHAHQLSIPLFLCSRGQLQHGQTSVSMEQSILIQTALPVNYLQVCNAVLPDTIAWVSTEMETIHLGCSPAAAHTSDLLLSSTNLASSSSIISNLVQCLDEQPPASIMSKRTPELSVDPCLKLLALCISC